MKLSKYFLLCFSFLLGMTACGDVTNDLGWKKSPEAIEWEISPDSVEKEIDGIAFKFCLLNEQGKPATVFNEGENFSFYFSVTNQSKKDFFYDAYLLAFDKNFLRIYNSSDFDFEKSYKPLNHTDIGVAAYSFNDGDVYIFKVPWLHEKNSVLCNEKFWYESIVRKPLVKGFYYTNFKYSFYFQGQDENNTIRTDSIDFKINFKIQ